MAITIEATFSGESNNDTATVDVSFTSIAGQGILIGYLTNNGVGNVGAVSSVTWDPAGDNQSLTLVENQLLGANRRLVVYRLASTTTAKAGVVRFALSGNHTDQLWIARRISGQLVSDMVRGSAKDNATGDGGTYAALVPTLGVSSAVGDTVFGFFAMREDTTHISAASGESDYVKVAQGTTRTITNGTKPGAAGTVTFAPTLGGGASGFDSALILVSIKEDPPDTTPDAFTFTDQTGVARGTVRTSNTLTVAGITAAASVTITAGGEWQKNGGAWGASSGTVVNGDTFAVRHTASLVELTAVNTTLTIGGVSDTFTSTTGAFVRILLAKQLNNEGSLPTFTLTGANQPVAGRKLYVGIGAWNGAGAVGESVTDSKSNSYTRKDSTTAVSNTRVQLYGCDYAGTGDVTITLGRGAGNWTGVYSYLFCLEIDGLAASEVNTSANGEATGSSSGTDASVTGAAATSQGGNVLIAMMAVNTSDSTANVTNPVGWTEIMTENDGSANECGGAAYKTISAIETPTAAWTYDDTGAQWQAAMIVLRQFVSGGGGEGGARRAMMMGVG